jgi:lipoyl(octanoyl) transferase
VTAATAVLRNNPNPAYAEPLVRELGLVDYEPTWRAMQSFTASRIADTQDEIWLLQSPPIYTVGLAGRPQHLPLASPIPVLKIDRGGQVTYHGPGQLIAYLLLDLRRLGIGVRPLVRRMETAVVTLLREFGITAEGRAEMPGVYVNGAKIAALGLRIKNGCCFHGLALNVDMDLAPFAAIDPCGFPGLHVTQTRDLGITADVDELGLRLAQHLIRQLAIPNTASATAAVTAR